MGIRGLTAYVVQRSKAFSKEIELHNTKLVIDGSSVTWKLYHLSKCNYCFGGDYLEYEKYVSNFFDELLKCNITPIIVFDGGIVGKKFDTILSRSKRRHVHISESTPANEKEVIPLLAKDVIKFIAQQKNIKIVQSLFEADDHIASIARMLKCPVLSDDSDFFIFDVMYIPVSSLEIGIFTNTTGSGFVKRCRVYTNEDFIKNFAYMDKKNLPLAAALLGNDYVDRNIFDNFFSSVIVLDETEESCFENKYQYKIEKLFKWLKNYSLNQAVAMILDTVYPEKREEILEIIEMIINGYLVPVSEMLTPLGYMLEEINKLTEGIDFEPYKFHGYMKSGFAEENNTNYELQFASSGQDIMRSSSKNHDKVSIPAWFLNEYYTAKFPGYFTDLLYQQPTVISEQMEDHEYPACIFSSLRIVRGIYKLLIGETTNSIMLDYYTRKKGKNRETIVSKHRLECNDEYFKDIEFPSLHDLKDLTVIKRKEILISILEVSDQIIMNFPPNWRLYVAVIKYWSVRAEKKFVSRNHVYSLILMIIYHVARKVNEFGSYFGERAAVSQADKNEVQGQILENNQVIAALEKVSKNDCTNVEEFFELYRNKDQDNFDISTVHAFSLLQNCLRYSMNLNALLDYPYPDLAAFINCTMIYNVYKDLEKYNDVYFLERRICAIFANSPRLSILFDSIKTEFQALLAFRPKCFKTSSDTFSIL